MGGRVRCHGRLASAGMPSRDCFVLLALLLCALALVSGCKEDQPPASLTQPERPFLYEADFARTPTLAARQDQVVVVDLEPTGGPQATAEDLSRYELEAGMYRFCIEKGEPYLEHLRLEDGEGQAAVDLDASAECVDVHLDGRDLSAAAPAPGSRHQWYSPGGVRPSTERRGPRCWETAASRAPAGGPWLRTIRPARCGQADSTRCHRPGRSAATRTSIRPPSRSSPISRLNRSTSRRSSASEISVGRSRTMGRGGPLRHVPARPDRSRG